MRVETRRVKHRGIRWIVSDERRVLAKGWFKDGKLRADFGEMTDDVMLALGDVGLTPAVASDEEE